MKKIKFLFFTLLFCFSVPVKADTAFENDDTVLCSFLKENVPENASPIESSLENEYRKTSSKPIDFYFFKRSEKTKSTHLSGKIRSFFVISDSFRFSKYNPGKNCERRLYPSGDRSTDVSF